MKLNYVEIGERLFNAVSEGRITMSEYKNAVSAIKVLKKL